jgi:hypothetical protein
MRIWHLNIQGVSAVHVMESPTQRVVLTPDKYGPGAVDLTVNDLREVLHALTGSHWAPYVRTTAPDVPSSGASSDSTRG